MDIAKVSAGKNPPWEVNVIIEVAAGSGSPVKYEMDKHSGALVVDRFLHTPMFYPYHYGFIPHTLSDDGDPMDVLVYATQPLVPGCVIAVRPIGALVMDDEAGQDEKILAVPVPKLYPAYSNIQSYKDLPEIVLQQIQHFFEHYKDLEKNKWVKVTGWKDANDAAAMIETGLEVVKKAS